MQLAYPCIMMRGGTSRGLYFRASDLPENQTLQAKILSGAIGTPNQIDGVGGGSSTTSKVAILSGSSTPGVEIDYLFAQILPQEPFIDWRPTCGNILAGVAPAAIELGLIEPKQELTTIAIRAVNTNAIIEATVKTPNGQVSYSGDTAIDGVPGTAAPILLKFKHLAGSVTAQTFPTGLLLEEIEGINVTCLDVAMPMVIARAEDFGKTGYETKQELDSDLEFLSKLESIRSQAGERMGLGDVSCSVIPKFSLIAPPRRQGNITSRYFVPYATHPGHAITGAICLSYCCLQRGSVAQGIALISESKPETLTIEHPSGSLQVELKTHSHNSQMSIESAQVISTARLLYSGQVYVPQI